MKSAAEAVLFAAGRYIEEDFVAKVLQADIRTVRKALHELQADYAARPESALRVAVDGKSWKLTVRDEYLNVAAKLVSNTEISGTVLETLAVIAWKNPIMQSELIKIRGAAAYEHIAELSERGYVTKVPEGRSFKLTLQEKFFEYFDVEGREDLKKLFAPIGEQAAQAQAEIDAKQADYDAKVRAAQEASGKPNSATPAPQTSPQPSAQPTQVPTDIVSELKAAAADFLKSVPGPEDSPEQEAEELKLFPDKAPEPEPVVQTPAPTSGNPPARTSGNPNTAAAIGELEKAVTAFKTELKELETEIAEENEPHKPAKEKHPKKQHTS